MNFVQGLYSVSLLLVIAQKPDAPIKRPKHVFNIHDIGTLQICLDAHAQWVSFKAQFIYKYTLSQKALSTVNIYKIVISLKSQVLRKEDDRLVADRQNNAKSFFAHAQSPWDTGLTRSPPELPGGFKVITTYFICFEQFGLF